MNIHETKKFVIVASMHGNQCVQKIVVKVQTLTEMRTNLRTESLLKSLK